MQYVELPPARLSRVINLLNAQTTDTAAVRICNLLANKPRTDSREILDATGILNLSDIVRRRINPKIYPLGLQVGCEHQPAWVDGEAKFVWSFFELSEAVNDPVYGCSHELQE